jgi:hypothetical protein
MKKGRRDNEGCEIKNEKFYEKGSFKFSDFSFQREKTRICHRGTEAAAVTVYQSG